jgi:hypothetical protein
MAMLRRAIAVMFVVGAAASACHDEGSDGAPPAVTTCDGGECNPVTVACRSLAPQAWSGSQPCHFLSATAHAVANELLTVWGTGPTSICSYAPTDTVQTRCGPTLANNAMYCPLDDSVSFDENFLNDQYLRFGELAPVVILAHEWGHLLQARAGLRFDEGPRPKEFELQADCYAGVFTFVASARGVVSLVDAPGAAASLWTAGDQTLPWFDPSASIAPHGRPDERVAAFTDGFQNARGSYLCNQDYARTHGIGDPPTIAKALCAAYEPKVAPSTTAPPPSRMSFECNGAQYACPGPGLVAGCCLNQAVTCPSSAPNYCWIQSRCTSTIDCGSGFVACQLANTCGP